MNKMNGLEFDIESSFGLYLHIPFCEGKCRYCDFYSTNFNTADLNEYLSCLKQEIKIYSSLLRSSESKKTLFYSKMREQIKSANNNFHPQIESIYIGGGTPGLLLPEQLLEILDLIKTQFSYPLTGEITLEANPDSLTEDKIAGYRGIGVNRLSLGVQSFNDKELSFLGRKHTGKDTVKTVHLIDHYFDNYNIDLIFALPGQGIDDWQYSLQEAISLGPHHISLYNLQIEENTPLAEELNQGKFKTVDDSLDAEMYLLAREMLVNSGYHHYEISNFAQQGFQSSHNRIYWEFKPYLGLGPAAHSFTGKVRYNNYSDLNKYNDILASKSPIPENLPIDNIIELKKEDLIAEKLFMGLRLLEGVSLETFWEDFGVMLEDYYDHQIKKLKSLGLIEVSKKRITLTEKGLLHGNTVFMEFLP